MDDNKTQQAPAVPEKSPPVLTGTQGGHTPDDYRSHIEMRHDAVPQAEALAAEQPVPSESSVQAAPEPQPEQEPTADDESPAQEQQQGNPQA